MNNITMLCEYSKEESQGEHLEEVPINKWTDIQDAFKKDWPRGVTSFTVLRAQRELIENGFGYGFKVFCPFGKVCSGMVAFNEKMQRLLRKETTLALSLMGSTASYLVQRVMVNLYQANEFYEIIIQCPTDGTKDLEDALKRTKLIDWRRKIVVPFAPSHVIECIKRVTAVSEHVEIDIIYPTESFVLQNKSSMFEVSLPPEITFGLLKPEHAALVNRCWPHKYPNSIWYFQLLINAKAGYGLFRDHQLISWVFINEVGILGHMYTIDRERRKGFADFILKMVCNILLQEGKDVVAFCVKGNVSARNLYKKAGFMQYDSGVSWCYLKPKEN